MIDAAQFHFLRPAWFFALPVLAVLVWLLYRRQLRGGSWEAVCDAPLLPHILIGAGPGRRPLTPILTAFAGLLGIIALAGPAWSRLPQPVFSAENALVIALDLSRSMDANDISPSRIERARFKVSDILKQRREGQTALIAYAGDAFTVTPLTDDSATINSQLQALSPDIMPRQGNRTDRALERAGELLRQAGMTRGDILLITDEIDSARSGPAVRALREKGYRVSVMGVGTAHGVPVPLADGGFLKDKDGNIVIPTLDEGPMRALASMGGGIYTRMSVDDSDVDRLHDLFSVDPLSDRVSSTSLHTDVWREQGPWLVLLLIPLAALAFRRGYLLVLLIMLLPLPRPAAAMDWGDLWKRPDQRAQQALKSGDNKRAAQLFRDPAWKGAAQYRDGDYASALKSFGDAKDVQSLYNKGNALARLGRYEDAIDAYDKVLKEDPEFADAKFNRDLVEKELKKSRQPPQDRQQNPDQGGQKQQQDQNGEQGQKGDRNQGAGQDKDTANDRNGGRDQDQSAQGNPGRPAQPGQQNKTPGQKQGQNEGDEKSGSGAGPQSPPSAGAARRAPEEQSPGKGIPAPSPDDLSPDEEQMATEQWLRRIPDDPAGLLRRKFLYQYQQRARTEEPEDKQW